MNCNCLVCVRMNNVLRKRKTVISIKEYLQCRKKSQRGAQKQRGVTRETALLAMRNRQAEHEDQQRSASRKACVNWNRVEFY